MNSCFGLIFLIVLSISVWATKGAIWGLSSFVLCAIVFLIWRRRTVVSGLRKRDEDLLMELAPIILAHDQGVEPSLELVTELAAKPQLRPLLYAMLECKDQKRLFPSHFLNLESQAISVFARWCMHPNEYGVAPSKVEVEKVVSRNGDSDSEGAVDYYVLRYELGEGHWAEEDGPMLGVSGPFPAGHIPYEDEVGAFSRSDSVAKTDIEELVDWYIKTIENF